MARSTINSCNILLYRVYDCAVYEVLVSLKLCFLFAYAVCCRDQNTSKCCLMKLRGVNMRMDERLWEGIEEFHAF